MEISMQDKVAELRGWHEYAHARVHGWRNNQFPPKEVRCMSALLSHIERLEAAARAALPFVVGEEEATELEAALTNLQTGAAALNETGGS
jgi:hypothetical protein